jgi:acetolactate synthase small subunit
MQQQTFEIRAKDAPGLLARVETILRRQRAPIRSFCFEGGEGEGAARLLLVADADEARSTLIQKQLLRLEDVTEVNRPVEAPAFAQPSFTFEEKTA